MVKKLISGFTPIMSFPDIITKPVRTDVDNHTTCIYYWKIITEYRKNGIIIGYYEYTYITVQPYQLLN